MKKILRKALSLLLALTVCAGAALPALAAGGRLLYGNTTALTDGFSYRHAISYTSAGKLLETHTLTVAPDSAVQPIVIACDTIYGGMTINQAVAWAESLGYNVVAGVNADFGYWSTRIPCGMVVENGVYKSSPDTNSVLAFGPDGAFLSLAPTITISLQPETGDPITLTHFNKTRTADGLYLYSEHFSTVSTRTSGSGWYVRLKIEEGTLSIGGTLRLKVDSVVQSDQAQPIGEGYLVLTAQDEAELDAVYERFSPGDEVTLTVTPSDSRLSDAVWATGYGNTLVYDGALYYPDGWEQSIAGVNPRTAVGIRPDGTLLIRVVDGRSSASAGLTLSDLAQQLMDEGCTYVANLDGGGSSAMGVRSAGDETVQIVNVPSDGTPRSCPSFLLFVAPDESDGKAAQLFAAEDGQFVLAGSHVTLHYLATDSALRTADAPTDVSARSNGLGSVTGSVYQAGSTGGADVLTLSSSSRNLTGTATLHVISRVDTLRAKNNETGKWAASSARLESGETLSLSLVPGCLGRSVVFDEDAAVWSVDGDAVTMTEPGVFTASGQPGSTATITGTLGGRSVSVSVSIPAAFTDMVGHWAAEYVERLADSEVVSGTSDTTFSPEAAMRRCDFVLMLWRAAGKPASSGASSFTDVPDDAYYAQAVAWAQQAGIAQGNGDTFNPLGQLTREQAFTLVRRAFDALGVSAPENAAALTERFADAADVSDWAVSAAADLAAMGVISGDGANLLPKAGLTRAQMAKILCLVLDAAGK